MSERIEWRYLGGDGRAYRLTEDGYESIPEQPTCPHCGQVAREGEWHNNTFRSLDGTETEVMCGLPDGRAGPGFPQPKEPGNE